MSFGKFGVKSMNTERAPKTPKSNGKKPFSSRTVLGVICVLLALLITFGVAPLVNRFSDRKVDIVRLKVDVQRGQIMQISFLTITKVQMMCFSVLEAKRLLCGKLCSRSFG